MSAADYRWLEDAYTVSSGAWVTPDEAAQLDDWCKANCKARWARSMTLLDRADRANIPTMHFEDAMDRTHFVQAHAEWIRPL